MHTIRNTVCWYKSLFILTKYYFRNENTYDSFYLSYLDGGAINIVIDTFLLFEGKHVLQMQLLSKQNYESIKTY